MAQKLSKKAAKAKAVRDLKAAKTPRRTEMKRKNQQRRGEKLRSLTKRIGLAAAKVWLRNRDWDHKDKRWEKHSKNRGNDGNGTKSEGKRNYKA
jgi:hypothetical protein